jgi:thiosulfate/3-mercaptopyruvate sulfurtransferase
VNVLIEPGELADLLGSGDRVVVADVRWNLGGPSGRPEFEDGHIPGARWVDLEQDLSGPPGVGGRHPLPPVETFEEAMRRTGVSADTPVIAYDAANALSASRLWWLLLDAGHDRVRVLNGGLAAWQAAGLPIETGRGTDPPPGNFVAQPPRLPRVSAAELMAVLGSAGAPTMIDVRAPERFSGESEPIDPVAGHIPGAINLPSMGAVDAAGRFASAADLGARYAGIGAEPVVYCGSGVTAAHTLLGMAAAGRTDGVIYAGSWSDWIMDPDRPVATGAA